MSLQRVTPVLVLAATILALSACGGTRVTRIEPTSVTDLSGRWNDTDSRLVANELIAQSLAGAWIQAYASTNGGGAPPLIVGDFRNATMEHIPVEVFVRDLERAYVNSGAVRVVASPEERSQVRDERRDQQDNARADTRARMAQELGARYMLQGDVQAIQDTEGREKVIFYQVDATLIDLESNEKVWIGQKQIKKYIERAAIKWE